MAEKLELTQEQLREWSEAVKGIRAKQEDMEKGLCTKAEFIEYQTKAEAAIDKFEKANADFVQKQVAAEAKEAEFKDRIGHLEMLAGNMGGAQTVDEKKNSHIIMASLIRASKKGGQASFEALAANSPSVVKRYFEYVKETDMSGWASLPPEVKAFKSAIDMQLKASPDIVRTDVGEFGGFLVYPEWSNELLRQIIEISPGRKYFRVKQIGGKSLMQPIRQGVPTALWEGETEQGGASISNYTNQEMIPYRLTNTVPVTWDMLNDNKYNISEEIMLDNALAFAQAEGAAVVNGNGVKKSLGFAVDADVPVYTSAASTLTFDDLIGISGEMKMGYNPMYMFNRRTMAYLRTLKDENKRYLWSGPFGDAASAVGATINGYRYSGEFIDMDDVDVATGKPILFCDPIRFYQITDRTDMIVIRDEFTRKKEGIVEFTFMRWTTGQAVMKEAGIILQLKAAQ